jgi:hypothetical protein
VSDPVPHPCKTRDKIIVLYILRVNLYICW